MYNWQSDRNRSLLRNFSSSRFWRQSLWPSWVCSKSYTRKRLNPLIPIDPRSLIGQLDSTSWLAVDQLFSLPVMWLMMPSHPGQRMRDFRGSWSRLGTRTRPSCSPETLSLATSPTPRPWSCAKSSHLSLQRHCPTRSLLKVKISICCVYEKTVRHQKGRLPY